MVYIRVLYLHSDFIDCISHSIHARTLSPATHSKAPGLQSRDEECIAIAKRR